MRGYVINAFSVIGGTGALGMAIATRLASAGHEVWIGSRGAEKAEAAALEVAAATGGSVHGAAYAEAATKGGICFLAVPYAAQEDTLAAIRHAVQGKILVDTTAPLKSPKVGTVQLPAIGCAAIETAAALGADVRVVSALQTIGAEKLKSGGEIDADVLVTADDADAAEAVRTALGSMGLRSWYAGPLANSAASEALTSVLIQLNRRYKLGQAGIKITSEKMSGGLRVIPLAGLPMFEARHDLAAAITDAIQSSGEKPRAGDVLVVAQKAVSKVEGRTRLLAEVTPSTEARRVASLTGKDAAVCELILGEASQVMRAVPNVIITRHRTGQVLANSGLDASNISHAMGEQALLWPADPDASARILRSRLEGLLGIKMAVIISDSLGRAWRIGTTGHAIGVAGIRPLRDRRGETDLFGRELQATITGVADEIASAASLVIGEGDEAIPAVLVRGAKYDVDDSAATADGLRPLDLDLFQ